ncbi:MAG: chromophore lyase CpcT/CpeT [Pyrinomonadaceae bacterium]|nr:chromophore lyase CpcT/CpeT [Pyrinomonadaceae bacterium]
MKKIILVTSIILLSVSSIFAKGLEDDLKIFTSWFEGRFDNFAQFYNDKENKTEFPHQNIHSIFKKVDLPQIGKTVFYVQQYSDGDEAKIYRQRLYNFTLDKAEKAIKLTIYNFDDEKKYRDSHLDSSKLNGLTVANLTTTTGCEVYWKLNKERDKFSGIMKKDACKVVSKRSGKNIIITDDLFLTKDEIWINDQAKDEQGNYIFGNKSGVHDKLKKVRWFEGWTAILKTGETLMSNQDFKADEYDGKTKILLHDQGGTVKLNDKYSVQLAQLQYKNGTWVLTLKVLENSTGKAVAYSWTNPEAEKLGINLRWVQAGFSLKK